MVPFVTTALHLHYLPASIAPPALTVTRITATDGKTRIAYRLTPTVYAHLLHAAERLLSRPIDQRPGPQATQELIDALEAVYAALLGTGVTPANIPPWSDQLPRLPVPPYDPQIEDCCPDPPTESGSPSLSELPRQLRPAAKRSAPRRPPARHRHNPCGEADRF